MKAEHVGNHPACVHVGQEQAEGRKVGGDGAG